MVSEPSDLEETGATWQGVEDSDHPERRADETEVREGRVADPNLGDLPVDDQPHPGSYDVEADSSEGAV